MIDFMHYLTIGLAVSIPAISAGISQGRIGKAIINAMNIQPGARDSLNILGLYGSALLETGAILGTLVASLLIFDTSTPADPFYSNLSKIGIIAALCISSVVISIMSSVPIKQAALSVTRQPFSAAFILRFVIITVSILQTPLILSLLISIFIKNQAASATSIVDSMRLIASGIALGIGSIGPAIGLARFSQKACEGLGYNRDAHTKIITFTFISQAIIETPLIFAVVVSFILLFVVAPCPDLINGIALLAAGCCIGFATIPAALASARTATAACWQIIQNPDRYAALSKISIFAQGIIDTNAIYALLVSLMLMLFV